MQFAPFLKMLEMPCNGWFAIVVVTIISVMIFKLRKSRVEKLLLKVPGPDYNFLFGNGLQLMVPREKLFSTLEEIIKPFRDKGICRLWLGHQPAVIILNAKFAEVVLSSTRYLNKSTDYKFLYSWLGTGLLTSTGSKWNTRRKLITPTFHFHILEDFAVVFNERALILTDILQKHSGKEQFDIYPYITRCTLDILCETAMGKSINAQSEIASEYVTAIKTTTKIIYYRITSPFLRRDFLFRLSSYGREYKKCLKILHEFSYKVIKERREQLQTAPRKAPVEEIIGQKRRLAFLDLLLESKDKGKGLTDEDIREEVDTFMFEGHDTTASSLAWSLYNIGRFPEVQQLVHEELERVIGNVEKPISFEEAKSLKYLECVIKESLRMFPAVPAFSRTHTEDLDLCGYTIPAGTKIGFSLLSMHRDPEQFPFPDKFDPDRFLAENAKGRHPYAYVPFSAGPRNCIGQKFALLEEKVVIAHILRRFKVTALDKLDDITLIGEAVLRSANGVQVKLENRNVNTS